MKTEEVIHAIEFDYNGFLVIADVMETIHIDKGDYWTPPSVFETFYEVLGYECYDADGRLRPVKVPKSVIINNVI